MITSRKTATLTENKVKKKDKKLGVQVEINSLAITISRTNIEVKLTTLR